MVSILFQPLCVKNIARHTAHTIVSQLFVRHLDLWFRTGNCQQCVIFLKMALKYKHLTTSIFTYTNTENNHKSSTITIFIDIIFSTYMIASCLTVTMLEFSLNIAAWDLRSPTWKLFWEWTVNKPLCKLYMTQFYNLYHLLTNFTHTDSKLYLLFWQVNCQKIHICAHILKL